MTPMRVALLTPLPNLDRNYSVCTVILQQVKMLERAGHEVVVYVKKGFNPRSGTLPNISPVQLPGFQVTDYGGAARGFFNKLGKGELRGYDAIFTHDFMFLPSFAGYREGVRLVAADPASTKAKWFHWSHSVPRKLPKEFKGVPGHVYVALIQEQAAQVARMYEVPESMISVVWNPTDVTDAFLDPASADLVEDLHLLKGDILGVLPFSMGRLEAKGIQRAVEYYMAFGDRYDVNLVLCNARSQSPAEQKRLESFTEKWTRNAEGKRFRFWWTSEVRPGWADCVPNPVIRDLQQVANLFIYPTIGEGNSLAIGEAMTGSSLCVLPESRVDGMREISDPGVFLCYWQVGHWREKKFKPAADVAREIEGFSGGQLGMKIHELRRKWRYSRLRIWQDQLKPMLDAHTGKRW
jgi:hypothetical protein